MVPMKTTDVVRYEPLSSIGAQAHVGKRSFLSLQPVNLPLILDRQKQHVTSSPLVIRLCCQILLTSFSSCLLDSSSTAHVMVLFRDNAAFQSTFLANTDSLKLSPLSASSTRRCTTEDSFSSSTLVARFCGVIPAFPTAASSSTTLRTNLSSLVILLVSPFTPARARVSSSPESRPRTPDCAPAAASTPA